jgi:hypothetical protein
MPDNKKNIGSPDRKTIDIKDIKEVRYWTKLFEVTPTQLKDAVKKVGKSAAAVKKELGK